MTIRTILKAVFAVVVALAMLLPVSSADVAGAAQKGKSLPESYVIADVPWHKQLNGLLCGAGSLEIVFDYWGPDIDQREIADVARTSSMGTWTPDIVRAGHFSYMSSAMGYFFPSYAPEAGYTERAIGYAAFAYSSETFWLEDLKALIANDIPVIVLMNYYPDGGGGHYRVVIGYDDTQQIVYFSDTWGRDIMKPSNFTGVITWSYSDFQSGWNYNEYGTEHPYWGAVIMPWSVEIAVKGKVSVGSVVTVSATVEYPCPAPLDSSLYPATDAFAEISLPAGMSLAQGDSKIIFGEMKAGTTASASWKVMIDGDVSGLPLSVTAGGIISGWVPDAYWAGNNVYYPAYGYTDFIGGEASIML